MTFIASVVAKNGVAIIADSLVTTSKPVIELSDFQKFIQSKKTGESQTSEPIKIEFEDVARLFVTKPSHTKDYEEKLFEYDKFIAVTTAGYASINGVRIEQLIEELINLNNSKTKKKAYKKKRLETKVKDFCNFFSSKVKQHLENHESVGETNFILTSYNNKTHSTTIYKVEILSAARQTLADKDYVYAKYHLQDERHKVVFDGQNRISERILFGDRATVPRFVTQIAEQIAKDFKLTLPETYYSELISSSGILNESFFDDMKIYQISQLSLQQAVDLACLLMRIEMDFQKYTRNIPTVGGVIKLAIIDNNGFQFINGHTVSKPDVI